LRSGVLAVTLVGIAVLAGMGGLYAWTTSAFTECFGNFPSTEDAEHAAQSVRDAGFSADLSELPSKSRRVSVNFESGETGTDAAEFRAAFWDALESNRGKSGHGQEGCLERGPIN